MAAEKPQDLKNHARFVPMFHMFVLPVLMVNIGWRIYQLVKLGLSFATVFNILLAVAFFLLALNARLFAMTVQDRVIRLEMRLRLAQVLPPEMRSRIPEFTIGQLVALRFASDAELPGLARKVLDEKLIDRKAIKQLIGNWQGDYLRA